MIVSVSEELSDSLLMVATDLDGTLLDYDDYDWTQGKPALQKLEYLHIPVIINSSKTAEEIISLQKEMSLNAPFIIESGSAILLPKNLFPKKPQGALDCEHYWKKVFGAPRILIVEVLRKLKRRSKWDFSGFSDWDAIELMTHTGLNESEAHLALLRVFSEPILWRDTQTALEDFKLEIDKYGLQIVRKGRFFHVLGRTDKSVPLRWLSQYYLTSENKKIEWLVLGDSANDIDMLEMADYPVVIKSPGQTYPQFTGVGETIFTKDAGPKGWNQAIMHFLNAHYSSSSLS